MVIPAKAMDCFTGSYRRHNGVKRHGLHFEIPAEILGNFPGDVNVQADDLFTLHIFKGRNSAFVATTSVSARAGIALNASIRASSIAVIFFIVVISSFCYIPFSLGMYWIIRSSKEAVNRFWIFMQIFFCFMRPAARLSLETD